MDLNRKGELWPKEHLLIAQTLQIVVLDEIARAARWSKGSAVFHGGTSIGTVWNSPRHSEDLDFMVARRERERLVALTSTVAVAVRARMAAWLPGSVIELAAQQGGDDRSGDVLDVWKVRWAHPKRLGKVLVKVEFYVSDDDVLASYEAVLATPRRSDVEVSVVLPVAELVSLWADKAKAIATRPAIKWRDLHDLGFLASTMDRHGRVPSDRQMVRAMKITTAVYGKTPADVAAGLRFHLDRGAFDDLAAFERDMERWYPDSLYEDYVRRGVFEQILRRSKEEAKRAVGLILAFPAEDEERSS